MTEKALGTQNLTIENYQIVEARNSSNPSPETAEWRVYYKREPDALSVHSTRKEAIETARALLEKR